MKTFFLTLIKGVITIVLMALELAILVYFLLLKWGLENTSIWYHWIISLDTNQFFIMFGVILLILVQLIVILGSAILLHGLFRYVLDLFWSN